MHREHIDLPGKTLRPNMKRWPFSDAVRAGDTLYLAGRIGIDPATGKPPPALADEARLVLDDLRRVLTAAGMTTADLVMVTIFAPDVADFAAFNAVYLDYFDGPLPARAFLGSGPLLFGARFELTATAVTGGADAVAPFQTVDLVDAHQDRVQSCSVAFRQFGGRRCFAGRIRTVRTLEDNALLREVLGTPGDGAVLVVDGGGSSRVALVGDVIAALAIASGWSGLLINGAIRDVARLATLDIGVKALASNPMKSAKNRIGEVDVPVTFGGVRFAPGAMLYSDEDGVLVSDAPLF
jgi:regulator of ribonuclease activity A